MKFIVKDKDEIDWNLYPNGEIKGFSWGVPVYSFWVGNPPAHDTKDHSIFIEVCEYAVAKGLLRPIYTYAVA